MTNKEFVAAVIPQIMANPRKVLAGHGISGAMLNKIKSREDIFKLLAGILNKLKTFKRGAIGLKKTSVFQIKAYKNFAELNTKARLDVEKFQSGLKGNDAENFNVKDNIVCVVFDPKDSGLEDTEERAAFGTSQLIKFSSAVSKEFKVPGWSYIVVMWGDSAIRTQEAKIAERKESRNVRENKREEKPAKVKKAMNDKRKAIAKLRNQVKENNQKLKQLRAQEQRLNLENQQLNNFGVDNIGNRKLKDARKAEIQAKLSKEVSDVERYIAKLDGATGKARRSLQSMISIKNRKIKELRAALGTYNRLGPAAIAKKAAMLKKVQEEIASRVMDNESLSSAINAALNSIDARPAQKQIIKQQVINQVAEGETISNSINNAVMDVMTTDGSISDAEINATAKKVLKETNGVAPTSDYMLKYQINRNGHYYSPQDIKRVGNEINNILLNSEEFNNVVDVAEEADETADILTSSNAAQELSAPVKRKRRTKKEMEIARKLAKRTKRLKEKEKREKLRMAREMKKAKLAAKREKALLRAAAKKKPAVKEQNFQDLIDALDSNGSTGSNTIDPVVQQIIDSTSAPSQSFQDLIDALDSNGSTGSNTIDPVVQQIIDSNDVDDYVDDEIIPDSNDSPNNPTDFAALLNML